MTVLLTIIGWFDLAGTVVLAGGYMAAALIRAAPDAGGRRAMQWAGVVLVAGLLAELVVATVRLAALSESGGLAFVNELFRTRWCQLWVARCAGLALLRLQPVGSWQGAGLAAVWLALRSFQGHAGAHGMVPAVIDWMHLLAAVTWIGSLLPLALRRSTIAPVLAERIRCLATYSVTALLPAGLYGAVVHVQSMSALETTPYGRVLMTKLALAGLLIALGAVNHYRYVPALRRGTSDASTALRHLVLLELIGVLLVLLLSALLGVLPMPHALVR